MALRLGMRHWLRRDYDRWKRNFGDNMSVPLVGGCVKDFRQAMNYLLYDIGACL